MSRSPRAWCSLLVGIVAAGVVGAQQKPSAPEVIRQLQEQEPKTRVDSILEQVETGKDGFITELYDEEIKVQLKRIKNLLGHGPVDGEKLRAAVAPEFSGTPLRPRKDWIPLRKTSPTVHRYRPDPAESVTAEALAAELGNWLSDFAELAYKEIKTTDIHLESEDPLIVRVPMRYSFAGRTRAGETLQLTGYWITRWRKDRARGWLWTSLKLEDGWESRAMRTQFADITSCALPRGPAYNQFLRGVDWWSANLDGASGMTVQGHSGVAVADVDGDGREDFYVCQDSGLPSRLFRSQGDGTFVEVSHESGVDSLDRISAALFFDFDNDGDQDLLLTSKELFLLQNDGTGHFTLLDSAGIGLRPKTEEEAIFFTSCVADYNNDGWLDVYVCSYFWEPGSVNGTIPIPYHDAKNGAPNFLFRNNGDGTFADVTRPAGLKVNNRRFSLACAWADYDKNGSPDLYVANDFGRNNLFRNNGDGTFQDVGAEAGVEDMAAGMSAAWADYDNDGWLDLYVGNMYSTAGTRTTSQPLFKSAPVRSSYRRHAKGNTLFRNRGDGTFEDTSEDAGVTMGRWAWSSNFVDFDLDGYEDIYVANGYVTNESTHDL